MNISSHSTSFMDIDSPSYSRWSYATSDARSEPSIAHIAIPQTRTRWVPQPIFCPPPIVAPPSPVQTSPGVWEDEDGIYYAPNWSPVQEYLDLIRKERRMLVPPSEIVFVLAALDVVYSPWDVAHWIFWPSTTYYTTADRVTAVACMFFFCLFLPRRFDSDVPVHQPRLIITKVPWIGSREHRWIVNAIQEKYYYVHILGRWYPTDFQPLETKKRALRSSGAIGDQPDMTINQFFNIVEDGLPPSKRQRKPSRRITEPQLVLEERRPRGTAHRKNTVTTPHEAAAPVEILAIPTSDVSFSTKTPHPSKRIKPQTAVDTNALSPTDSEVNHILFAPGHLSSPSHSRNRSTSQSSEQTVVPEEQDPRRSMSLESAATAVASSSPSKKRKAEILEDTIEESDQLQPEISTPAEGMITRGRSKIARTGTSAISVEVKKPSTPLSPITRRTKLTPKARSRKPRS